MEPGLERRERGKRKRRGRGERTREEPRTKRPREYMAEMVGSYRKSEAGETKCSPWEGEEKVQSQKESRRSLSKQQILLWYYHN